MSRRRREKKALRMRTATGESARAPDDIAKKYASKDYWLIILGALPEKSAVTILQRSVRALSGTKDISVAMAKVSGGFAIIHLIHKNHASAKEMLENIGHPNVKANIDALEQMGCMLMAYPPTDPQAMKSEIDRYFNFNQG